jgi:hypothetical protein
MKCSTLAGQGGADGLVEKGAFGLLRGRHAQSHKQRSSTRFISLCFARACPTVSLTTKVVQSPPPPPYHYHPPPLPPSALLTYLRTAR